MLSARLAAAEAEAKLTPPCEGKDGRSCARANFREVAAPGVPVSGGEDKRERSHRPADDNLPFSSNTGCELRPEDESLVTMYAADAAACS